MISFAAWVGHAARAQGVLGAAPVSEDDVERISRVLHLAPEQLTALHELYGGFVAQFEELVKPWREARADRNRPASLEERAAAVEHFDRVSRDYVIARRQLESAFLSDLALLLRPSQSHYMEDAERLLRRKRLRSIGNAGSTGWTSLNLTQAVEDAQLAGPDAAAVTEIVAEWERSVDARIVQREQRVNAALAGTADRERERQTELLFADYSDGEAIGAITRQYARKLAGSLTAAGKDQLNNIVHPRVYMLFAEPRRAKAALKAVAELQGLTPEQAEHIEAISLRYARESQVLDAEVITLSEATSDASNKHYRLPAAERDSAILAKQDPISRLAAHVTTRREELEARTMRDLVVDLTPSQRSLVEPSPP